MLQWLWTHLADVGALGALVLSLFAAIRSGQAATVDAFDKLCKALMARIEDNEKQIIALKAEQARLQCDNEKLRGQVAVLEAENVELRKQLHELQQKRRRPRGA
jgi:phage shock protein A